jgi:hypothetical protein
MMATVIKYKWNGCHSHAMMLTVTKHEPMTFVIATE